MNVQCDDKDDATALAASSSTTQNINGTTTLVFGTEIAYPQAGQWIEGNFTGAGVLHSAGAPNDATFKTMEISRLMPAMLPFDDHNL